MKKSLKAISQSMKVSARCQMRTIENWDESLGIQKRNLALNLENLSFARDANRLMMKQFELEHTPVVSVLEGLLELVAVERITDVKSQEVVDDAKRMIRLMKSAQEK